VALSLTLILPGTGPAIEPPLFQEVPVTATGLTWVHENAMSSELFLPETMGPGVAFLDYDNDGWPDVLVTAYGRCILYHNRRDGTFDDVTDRAGVAPPGWTTSALLVRLRRRRASRPFPLQLVEFGKNKNIVCGDNKLGLRFYCIPRVLKPTPSLLFHNDGDGKFTETSGGTDIAKALGKALGVVATDVDNDRRMDIFVANDTVQNFLFMNRGGGRWEEIGLPAEVGFSANGQPRSGMGVDAGDVDGDGLQELFVANVDQEMFSLYRNNGDESFVDTARAHGVAEATRLLSGWGLKFFDFDDNGDVDLFLANGHPDDMVDQYGGQVTYREPLLLFRNDGARLRNVSCEAGSVFAKRFPARGLAAGDYDNDGRGVSLEGTACNRDAVGALITWSAGVVRHSRLKTSGGSYLSSHDPREVLGLGTAAKADWVEVKWPAPSGRVDRIESPPVNRYVRIVEGKGIV
jgi:hypothetical protein